MEVRTGAIVKNSEFFLALAEPDLKTTFFSRFRVPFDYPAHSLQKKFYTKPVVPMESRDSEGVPFASLESL